MSKPKRNLSIIGTAILLLLLVSVIFLLFLIFTFPRVSLSESKGFNKGDIFKLENGKLRFVVPERLFEKANQHSVEINPDWFQATKYGKITEVKAKPGKQLALNFEDKEHDSVVFSIATRNRVGIKREYDVIVDYSNFVRVFFSATQENVAPRKPLVMPRSKVNTDYKDIVEELSKISSFSPYNSTGQKESTTFSFKEVLDLKTGQAYHANTEDQIRLVYDFVLKGILKDKNKANNPEFVDYISKTQNKITTLNPNGTLNLETSPFFVSEFLGWYYVNKQNEVIEVGAGQEINVPELKGSEFRLVARYKHSIDNNKLKEELNKKGLFLVTYFDGTEKVFSYIARKGESLINYRRAKSGHTLVGWYLDPGFIKEFDFDLERADKNISLYAKYEKENVQPQPSPNPNPTKYTVKFITTPSKTKLHDLEIVENQKISKNYYLNPDLVTYVDQNGDTYKLSGWKLEGSSDLFDFETPITKNITLVAVFEKSSAPSPFPKTTEYKIKRLKEKLNNMAYDYEEYDTETITGVQAGSEVQLTPDKLLAPRGFELFGAASDVKKIIEADGSTVFKLYFKRKTFKATFNYNGGVLNSETKKEVQYKFGQTLVDIEHPTKTDPTGNKTYTFLGWLNPTTNQLVDFAQNNIVEESLNLVAKWQETNNFKKVYLNLVYEGLTTNQETLHELELLTERKIGSSVTASDQEIKDIISAFLSSQPHPNHETNFDPAKSISNLTVENNSDKQIIKLYYKAKTYRVTFNLTETGLDASTIDPILSQPLNLKYTNKISADILAKLRSVKKTNTNTHDYVFEKLLIEETNTEFDPNNAYNSNITLKPVFKTVKTTANITYTIRTQKPDGSYTENTEIKSGKIGSNHTVHYANPNSTVYQNPEYSVPNLTVNANETQNKVTVTVNRNTYTVTYQVDGHASTIPNKTFRHGQTHGEIDESQFYADGLDIVKLELDNTEKTKEEIKILLVTKNHKIKVYISEVTRIVGKYPQTKIDNPAGIQFERDDVRELNFNSKAVDYKLNFTRKYYKDNSGNKYEMYNGNYYKFEDVEFVRIPKQKTWFTKRIIDFTPFNIYIENYPDNAKPERSIFNAMVEEIGKILETTTYMPTYDNSEFSVKPILDVSRDIHPKLKRESTDYAKAVLNQHSGHKPIYRGADLNAYPSVQYHSYYHSLNHQGWWLGAKYLNNQGARFIDRNGYMTWGNAFYVYGMVVCIR